MKHEPEPKPEGKKEKEKKSWGGQDGFEIQSEGMENEIYKGGSQEVYDKLDATYVMGESLEVVAGAVTNFVAGAEVSALAGLSLEMALAPKIEWQPIPFAVQLHGLSHWRTAFSDAWHHQTTNFTATSVGSHTQTVAGPSTWDAVSSTWTTDFESTWSAGTDMTLSATKTLSCNGLSVKIQGEASCAISSGNSTKVWGEMMTKVFCGNSMVLLTPAVATLATGSGGGIKATAAQTVISGTKVMIGIPGSPVVEVATKATIRAPGNFATRLQATIVQARLAELEKEVARVNEDFEFVTEHPLK